MSLAKRFLVIGISHHQTPLEVRELFSLSPEQVDRLGAEISGIDSVCEFVLLNTCNRVEVYLFTNGSVPPEAILNSIARHTQQDVALLSSLSYCRSNSDMVLHLFRVAAGLDSQMIGETEILGQLKQTLTHAREKGWSRNQLSPLFERAFQAAKWIRTHTGIGQGQVTIGNVVVDLATRIFGNLASQRVLVIGSGEVAAKTVQSLHSRGATDITVTARSFEKAESLAREIGGSVLPFESFQQRIHPYDILICSTAAPTPILRPEEINEVRKARRFRPLLLIDVSIPRDVAADVGDLDQVFLYNLDDLAQIANENLRQREEEVAVCLTELKQRSWRTWLRSFRRNPLLSDTANDPNEVQNGVIHPANS